MSNFEEAVLFEHRFWLQIMGDHGRFIYNSLSPSEKVEIENSLYFINSFDELLDKSRKELNTVDIDILNKQAYNIAREIREFKIHLLQRHLVGNIKIGLPPTFINHMINEVEEYIEITRYFLIKKIPSFHSIHHHCLWLPDTSCHASAIASNLDEVEKKLIKKGMEFSISFQNYYIKAIEISNYMRTNLDDFPALDRYNREVETEILLFISYLSELLEMKLNKKILNRLLALLPDHMLREECYYLTKLSEVSKIIKPRECCPTKPRIED